jgi:N utilization substance protein B
MTGPRRAEIANLSHKRRHQMTQTTGLSGNQKRKMRSASRLYAVQALFQMEHSGQTLDAVCVEFLNHRFGENIDDITLQEGDSDLFQMIVREAVNYQAPIDQMTDRALVAKWPLGRIDPTLRSLFRAAGAEFLQSDTPAKIIIAEYVDLAAAFYPAGKDAKFANAVLDHMARDARPDDFQ